MTRSLAREDQVPATLSPSFYTRNRERAAVNFEDNGHESYRALSARAVIKGTRARTHAHLHSLTHSLARWLMRTHAHTHAHTRTHTGELIYRLFTNAESERICVRKYDLGALRSFINSSDLSGGIGSSA